MNIILFTDLVERILNETNLKVFIYNGQLDVVIPTSSTLTWIEKLHWNGAENWKKSERKAITIDNYIEGYVQGSTKLKMFWINRAGHMVHFSIPYNKFNLENILNNSFIVLIDYSLQVPEDNYQATRVMLHMLTNA